MIDPEALIAHQAEMTARYGDVKLTKSPRSAGNSECVQLGKAADGRRIIADSKLGPNSPLLVFEPGEWQAFVDSIRAGELE